MKIRTTKITICTICKQQRIVRSDSTSSKCKGCHLDNMPPRKPIDISGQKFGRLMVVSLGKMNKGAFWNCICDCGNKCIISGNRLRTGKTKSCGCITSTRGNLSYFKEYRSWKGMLSRCYDSKNIGFDNYGGRGIKVCTEWRDFNTFLHDMGSAPQGMTIDRIDVNGDYNKQNCRWASYKQQANNKRNNYLLTAFGETKTITQWANEYNISLYTIKKRIEDLSWPIEKAISQKARAKRKLSA